MSVSITQFRERFTEFSCPSTFSDNRIQIFIDDALLCIDERVFDKFFDLAVCYLTAHELFLANKIAGNSQAAEEVGTVTSLKAGDIAKSRTGFSGIAIKDGGQLRLMSTTYGLKFIEILHKVRIPSFLAITGSVEV